MRQVTILLLSIALFSCKAKQFNNTDKSYEVNSDSSKEVVNNSFKSTEKITPEEIAVKVSADSSEGVYDIKNGRIEPIAEFNTGRSELVKVIIDSLGRLHVKSICHEDELKRTIYKLEKTIEILKDSSKSTKSASKKSEESIKYVPVVTNILKWWQKMFMYFGMISAGLIALRFIWKRIEKTYL